MRSVALELPLLLVGQFPVEQYLESGVADSDEQDIDLTLAKVSFRAVDAEAEFTLGRE